MLERYEELLLTAPTRTATNEIGGSTKHASMSIKVAGKKSATLNSNAWTQCTSLIIDKVSMINLKLLASMDRKICEAKS